MFEMAFFLLLGVSDNSVNIWNIAHYIQNHKRSL